MFGKLIQFEVESIRDQEDDKKKREKKKKNREDEGNRRFRIDNKIHCFEIRLVESPKFESTTRKTRANVCP